MRKSIYLSFALLTLLANCQTISDNEKLEDWVFPQKDNFKWFKTTFLEKGYESADLTEKTFYFKMPNGQFGTLEATFLNGISGVAQGNLFELKNDEIKLLRTQRGKLGGGNIKKSYDSNNTYWKLPIKNDTIKWNHIREDTYVKCISYWNYNAEKEKMLVVEREVYYKKERVQKEKEYYKKQVGLTKIEFYGKSDAKMMMEQTITESGIDPDPKIKPENFSLYNHDQIGVEKKLLEQKDVIEWQEFKNENGYSLFLPNFFKEGTLVASGTLQYYENDIDENISVSVETFGMGTQSELITSYKDDLKIYNDAVYKVFKTNWYVISGKNSEGYYYNKSIIKNGSQYHLRISYPLNRKELFDRILSKTSNSFK